MKLDKESRKRIAGSVFVFFGCYLVMLFAIFLMIVVNDPHGWMSFFKSYYTGLVSLAASVFFLFGVVYFYYFFEDRAFLAKYRNIALVYSLFTLCAVLCFVFGRFMNVYARPYALFAMLCLILFSRRQAIILNFIFVFLMFSIDLFSNNFLEMTVDSELYTTLILGFISGTLAVFIAAKVKTRGGLLLAGVALSLPTIFVVLLFQIPDAEYTWLDYVTAAGFRIFGCLISAVLTLALLPVFEKAFNRLTVFRLRELTSTTSPLLNRLKQEAPGTFNHSMIVAQLAETCAVAIGENAELARAVAYYHDVGKLKQPDCFTENQTDYNVHDELTPELSADIIRSHTKDGYEIITHYHLPQIFADVTREHHGTLPIKYFYDKANRLSGGDSDIKDYSYLGPTPSTKIAAIIMIADASEAAVRAGGDRSPGHVEQIVRSIIEERMDLDQFAHCDITQKELTTIKLALVDALSGVHHHRVKYPAIRFTRDKKAVEDRSNDRDDY